MEFLTKFAPNFSEIFKITFLFTFKYYGWVLFVIVVIYMLWRLYRIETMEGFVESQKWIFLNIRVPRDNLTSTLAVESIFSQMHALHVGKTLAETYIEGEIQLWYSLEIVSFGGKVSFIIRLPKKMKNVVESAFYSQYPDAEISEIEDYMKNVIYDPEKPGDVDIWGTEWKLNADYVIPIKTYKDFEHPAAEETVVDPLAPLFESMTKIDPHEFFGVQIIIQPLADNEWQPRGEKKVKELIGEEPEHEMSFLELFLKPFGWLAGVNYKKALLAAGHGHGEEIQKSQKNDWMSLTDFQKEKVGLIEKKIGKQGYKTKIRFMYMAPDDERFDLTKKSMFTGAYRPLGSEMTNKLRPDVAKTWTAARYIFSPTLEKPFLDWILKTKKRRMFKGFKGRDTHIGLPMFVLNTEELATLFHFPITTETQRMQASIEQTQSKKVQPPVDLPVADL